jgi:hypothetical protein
MFTGVLTNPEGGAKPLMVGAGRTVKRTPLLDFPLTVTTTLRLLRQPELER